MKRRISFSILIILLVGLFISLGTVRKVPAKSGCSNASLKGSYGLHATGTLGGDPIAAVGVFTFDGAGNLTGELFFRTPGGTLHLFPTGTYTVNSDCTVSDTWGGSTHESVIVDDGEGYLILNTSDGVISGEAKKQFTNRNQED
jgi:hypothetical protein